MQTSRQIEEPRRVRQASGRIKVYDADVCGGLTQADVERINEALHRHERKDTPGPVCMPQAFVSRTCELGTSGCDIRHAPRSTRIEDTLDRLHASGAEVLVNVDGS